MIAQMFAASEGYVREVIHAFNDNGFAALDPKWSGGRPRKYGPVAHQLICQTARATPSALGLPFTTWSLTKLAEYLTAHYRLPVSTETIRRVLREAEIQLAGPQDVEGQPRPGLRREDGPHPRPV